jgi:16S rRNA (cytidine1402-2'-O)-methyltransferase
VAGTLIVCAGPIGNLGDAPPRLAEALDAADVVYAEDTRRARVLLGHLGVDADCRSYFAGNEERRGAEIADRLEAGETVAVLTDAGTPAISDPGLTAVRAAVEVGATVTGVPGPSAVTLALAVSGLPADRFAFEGFLPRSGRARTERLAALSAETRTTVLFCSPRRLAADLADLADVSGSGRAVVVCREMTKMHEEVWRGSLEDATDHWSGRETKGEVTVVLGGAGPPAPDLDAAEVEVRERIERGERPSSAVKAVAAESGVSRNDLYERVLGPG